MPSASKYEPAQGDIDVVERTKGAFTRRSLRGG